MPFLLVLELFSDSLMAIQVEKHQCPLHKSILLTQEPIHKILAKKFQELAILENKLVFQSAIMIFFSFGNASFSCKQVKVSWLAIFDDYSGFLLFFTLGKHFAPKCTSKCNWPHCACSERGSQRERQGTRERGHDACEQNQDLGIASKDKKKARSCRRFCCALLLRRLCSLMQTSSLCNEVVTLAGQKHHNFIVSETPQIRTVSIACLQAS